MSDDEPQPIQFISQSGELLGEWSSEELSRAADLLLADLLEHAGDREKVTADISGVTLVDEVPAALLFGTALEHVVVDILGRMGHSAPELLKSIARRLREQNPPA